MSGIKTASGYANEHGLFIPAHASGKILYDFFCEGDLPKLARTDFDITDGKSLACYEKAYFSHSGEVCETDYDEGHNGQATRLDMNMRTDFAEACQELKFDMKFSRSLAARMCENWNTYGQAAEVQVNRWMTERTEGFGLVKIAASAAPYNVGNSAGKITQSIELGTFANPLSISILGSTVIAQRMLEVAMESSLTCAINDLILYISPKMYSGFLTDQSKLGTCCPEDNPFVTGMVKTSLGFNLLGFRNGRTPYAGVNGAGQKVWYIMLINPMDVWFPFDLHYFEWDKRGHDMYLIGYGTYGLKVFRGDSVVVAAVTI